MLEHGAYTLLLDTLYATGELPRADKLVFKICGASTKRERNAVKNVLSKFFLKKPGGFSHKRYEQEVKHSESRIKAAQENGRKGGRPQKQKPSDNPAHNPEESYPAPAPTPEEEREEKSKSAAKPTLISPVPPSWLPLSTWLVFLAHRKKLGSAMTEEAMTRMWAKLERFKEKGIDPVACLDESICNGWLGVFEPKEHGNGQHESFHEKRSRQSASAITTVLDRFEKASGDIHRALPPARE
jgi:uncharacterized protein YdaU (DUF1376 family)